MSTPNETTRTEREKYLDLRSERAAKAFGNATNHRQRLRAVGANRHFRGLQGYTYAPRSRDAA